MTRLLASVLFLFLVATSSHAQGDGDLANKLSNPISDLISVPFQYNYDCCFGVLDAPRHTLNIQPVIPFTLNPQYKLVVRTIVPLIHAEEPVPFFGTRSGLGDTTQSFFLVPSSVPKGVIFGIVPVILWPTATDSALGSEKWGAGPTIVIGKQESGWTYGVLANHISSFAGWDNRVSVSSTFLQPFISYAFPDTTTFTLNTESTYDWMSHQWTVPIHLGVSKIFKFGKQPVSLGVQGGYFAVSPPGGPE
jgi:hypothetical protein